jgi:hypothetical protein
VFASIDPTTGGGLLADNGGPTQTIAILPGGPAAGAADPATSTPTDQRGVARDADPDLGAFEAPLRVEAETLTLVSGFKVENLAEGSGGKVIKSPNAATEAKARFTFTGEDGTYDIDLGYFDENDGQASLALRVGGVLVDSFVWSQNLGSANAVEKTRAVRHIADVEIETGDVIELVGHSNGSEPLRTDFLDFTRVGTEPPPPPPPEPFRVEAETLTLVSGFKVENLAVGSGGKVIKSPNAATEAKARFTFDGADGTYDIDLGYFDENDGQASLALRIGGVLVDSFVWSQNLGSANAVAKTRAVRHIAEVAIETGDVIELVGHGNGSEPLRTDYLDFTFVDDLVV